MDRMNQTNNYESRLWRLLEEQELADLSQYHQPGFFDEVPLYCREADVDFLPEDDKEATTILLRFALKFLKSVVAYESHRSGYVAAITVWDFADAPIVPNLFVWCDSVRELKKKMALKAVTTPFGKQMKKLIPRLNKEGSFDILEDASTLPDATRVFIALARAPYRGFVTLDHFRKRARAAK
ncbi:MAG: hypothetical protein ACRELF_01555 [Gemmataceae bacterium]